MMETKRPTDIRASAAPQAPFARREDRVAYELHRSVAAKLAADPQPLLAFAERNIPVRHQHVHGTLAHGWVDRWQELIHGPVDDLIDAMLSVDDEAKELRQNSPFAGALTRDERLEAIERAAR